VAIGRSTPENRHREARTSPPSPDCLGCRHTVTMLDGTRLQQKLVGSEDERAVSPVIGVILMVAITVILAAVIAAFVLDLGPGDPAPQASIEWDVNTDYDGSEELGTLSHGGGDSIDLDDARFIVESDGETSTLTAANNDFDGGDARLVEWNENDPDSFAVGNSTDLEADGIVDQGDEYELTLVHDPSDSIVFNFEGEAPDNS